MSRAYCRDDKPFPVSDGAMFWLRIAAGDVRMDDATRHFERLQLGGYIKTEGNQAVVTEAGSALLRAAEQRAEGATSDGRQGDHDSSADAATVIGNKSGGIERKATTGPKEISR